MHSNLPGPSIPSREPAVPGQLVTLVRLRADGTKSRGTAEHGYLVLEDFVMSPQVPYRPARSFANLFRAPYRLMGVGALYLILRLYAGRATSGIAGLGNCRW